MKPEEFEDIEQETIVPPPGIYKMGRDKTIVGGEMPKNINPEFNIIPAACFELRGGKLYNDQEVIAVAQSSYDQGWAECYKAITLALKELKYDMTADMIMNNVLKKLRDNGKLIEHKT